MSRRCELKLIDVLKEGNLDMAKSKFNSVSGTKSDTPIESRSSRTRFGNTSTLKKKYDSGTLKQQTEITSKKRKKLNDVSELPSKKIFTGSNIIKNPVKPDKEISQKKKRKTKSRESCWENKLTGARRVSKRLSNLKISLKKLESSLATSFVTIKTRQPVAFSARGKMKQNHCDLKPPKKNKTTQYINFPETQFNFGKLGHTKRLHPKITTARRPETYTVTVKSTASASHSRRNDKKQGNITHNTFDEDSNDSDVNLLIERCVEDIQNDLSERESDTEEDKKISKAYQLLKSKETIEENEEKAAQDTKVDTLICEQVDELTDDSTILIGVNVESKVNIERETLTESTSKNNSESKTECKNIQNNEVTLDETCVSNEITTTVEDLPIIDLEQDNCQGNIDEVVDENASGSKVESGASNGTTAEDTKGTAVGKDVDISGSAD